MQTPLLQRIRQRPAPLPITATFQQVPGGLVVGLDLDEALARLELRQALREAGVRGRV